MQVHLYNRRSHYLFFSCPVILKSLVDPMSKIFMLPH